MKWPCNPTLPVKLLMVVVFASLGIGLCVKLWINLSHNCDPKSPTLYDVNSSDKRKPSPTILGVYKHAAVATDTRNCSLIGVDILKKGGSVSDAAIASLICIGVVQPTCTGLGGGFILVKYNATTQTTKTLNARSRAPHAAHKDMFNGNPKTSSMGPLSVAVPGELKGYYELWKESGILPWHELFEPSIKLAEGGFEVTPFSADWLNRFKLSICKDPHLRLTFENNDTRQVFKAGEIIRRPVLAETLRKIANHPDKGDILYSETSLMKDFVGDLREHGGIITEQDMLSYTTTWDDPIKVDIAGNFTLHTVPPPGGGVLFAFLMKLLSSFDLKPNDVVSYHRIVEAFKHAYAKRTLLGDPDDENARNEIYETVNNLTSPEYTEHIRFMVFDYKTSNSREFYGAKFYQTNDHGTSHVSILAPNGDAISVTSTINTVLGSTLISDRTGIMYDNAMDDFAVPGVTNLHRVPPSINNFILPRKRPLSSMSPTIFVNQDGSVRLIIGSAGGPMIPSALTLVAIKNLWFGEDIKAAIDSKRIHHQLDPMILRHEAGFNLKILNGLTKLGHKVKQYPADEYLSTVQAIAVDTNGIIYANADFRKDGVVSGY